MGFMRKRVELFRRQRRLSACAPNASTHPARQEAMAITLVVTAFTPTSQDGGGSGGDDAENTTTISAEGETVSITTPSIDDRSTSVLVANVPNAAWAVLSSVETTCACTLTLAVESCRRDTVLSVMFRMTSAAVT